MWFERDYHPFRKELSTRATAEEVGCHVEYVRAAVKELPPDQAALVQEWNDSARRNEQTWRVMASGCETIRAGWNADAAALERVLHELGASSEEIEGLIAWLKTPLRMPGSAKQRASMLLKQFRKHESSIGPKPSEARPT